MLGGMCTLRDVVRMWWCIFFSFLFISDTLYLVYGSCDHFDIHCTYILYTFFFSFLSISEHYILYIGLVTILTYIVLIFFIYWCMFSPTFTCVVSFLSLYTCFLYFVCNLLFMFHTKMPWWVLFKVFQKYRLSKFSCHKLSSCKVFQEFVLG